MHIEETTAEERVIISNAICGAFAMLERVQRLLEGVQDDYFGQREQDPLSKGEAVDVSDRLNILNWTIFDILLELALLTGQDFCGVAPHIGSMKRAEKAKRCDKACLTLEHVEMNMSADKRKTFQNERVRAMSLPDEQATPILEELLRRAAQ